MKIAVSGKGGVGKTSVAAGLVIFFEKQGKRVIAIDADPDANLAATLGFSVSERPSPISELKKIILERTGEVGTFFKLNPKVDDIPDKFSARKGNIRLIEMGTVKKGGAGCVCPESAFLKALLSHIFLNRDEVVIVDMEAGIEHLGRGTAQSVEKFLIVVEPNNTSLDTAKKINSLAEGLGIKDVSVIGNKIRSDKDKDFIDKNLKEIKVQGYISLDEELLNSRGILPEDSKFIKNLAEVFNGKTNG
ncbi:MAG: carbon monoxide dehydrogenase [Candidatus Omnitrophica bacterium CG_4_9_14_0_2_um_filter_42_8]|nr:MAG: carbon monoxide dehydrogenase [Candidatus Omnitrophica bacterium CG22_combo_CG10-13_8_21_14_all_43_16]PJC48286.1 MAG: carbon monoxide dehydrogenase [Candidatus Omnitrophica bacterium CG_4_9_14_0_2_um_filter_42_8]